MDRVLYKRGSEVNEIERVCNDLDVKKYSSGNECNAEVVLYNNAKQGRVSDVTRHSHNQGKNIMGGELAVTENAENSDSNHGQGGDMDGETAVKHANVKRGRVFDITQHSHDAVDNLDGSESDISMRHYLDGSLNDTAGRLKSNGSQYSDRDMHDGSRDGDRDDTAGRPDNSQGSDAGWLDDSQGSSSDIYAGRLDNS